MTELDGITGTIAVVCVMALLFVTGYILTRPRSGSTPRGNPLPAPPPPIVVHLVAPSGTTTTTTTPASTPPAGVTPATPSPTPAPTPPAPAPAGAWKTAFKWVFWFLVAAALGGLLWTAWQNSWFGLVWERITRVSEVSAPETRAPAPTSTVTTPIERVRHDFSWMITVGLVLAVFGALALWAKLGGKTSRLFAGLATAVVIGFIVLVTPVGLHYFVMDLSQATMETAIPSHVSPAASTTQARIVTVRFPNNVEIVPATIRPGQILFAQISPARQRNVQFCPVRDDADRHALQHLRGYQGTVTPVLNGVELKLRSEIEDYYRRVGKPIEFRVHLVSADNTAC